MDFFEYYNSLNLNSRRQLRQRIVNGLGISESTFYRWYRSKHFPTYVRAGISKLIDKPVEELFPEEFLNLAVNDYAPEQLERFLNESLRLECANSERLSEDIFSVLKLYRDGETYRVPVFIFSTEHLTRQLKRWLGGCETEVLALAKAIREYFLGKDESQKAKENAELKGQDF